MRSSPLPYWYRQLQEAVEVNGVALERGYGLTVVLSMTPGGKILAYRVTQNPPCLDTVNRKP